MQRLKRIAIFSIVAGLCIGGIVNGVQPKGDKQVAEAVVRVRTAVVGAQEQANRYTYSGDVRGRYESRLAFQVGGKILRRHVETGSVVKSGDVLMEIDAKDIRQLVNAGAAGVSAAQSQLRLAETNLERYRQLLAQGAISQAQYDQHATAYDAAAAGLRQADAQYTQGLNQLEYSLLRADKPGVVATVAAEAGQVVAAGQSVITLVQDGDREVEISVPENRLDELRQSRRFSVTFWALPKVAVEGRIREIAPVADPVTRTYTVRISLMELPPEVKLGMTASVTVADSAALAVTIPLSSVYQDGNQPCVWVVSGDILELRSVNIDKFGKETLTVAGGLRLGERIVTAGVHKLKAGQRVKWDGDSL